MAKLTLTDVANITGAESTAITTINTNWASIETALENTLSRDGTTPNTMSADLDLNSNDLLNVNTINGVDPANLAGTITIGTVTTGAAGSSATVSNSGTSNAAIFDFSIPRGDTGATGAAGSDGADGTDGFVPGLKYTFSSTTTDSDPGSGTIRFNHGTFASITELYLDNEDSDTIDVSGVIDLWDDVVNAVARGYLRIYKADDSTVVRVFKVSGAVTDATGYRKVAVTPVHSSGS